MNKSEIKSKTKKLISGFIPPKVYVDWKMLQHYNEYSKYKVYLRKNERFKNIHKGKRCFIIGNGLSLKNLDFSVLEKEIVFTVNQLSRNPKFYELKTNYHFWGDPLYFDIHEDAPEDMELLNVMRKVNKDNPDVQVFYDLRAFKMIRQYRLYEQLNISYFGIVPVRTDKFEKTVIDFTRIIPNYPTVIFYEILMAVYMGCTEIYLLGCDCTGLVSIINGKIKMADKSLYGYEISENEKKRMEKHANERSLEDEVYSYLELLRGYRRMYQYCERNGAKLFNATEESVLESVPKVKLENILGH